EVALVNLAAADLGGDYCDVVRTRNGQVLFVIGDVTGHGVSSALLMAMAKAMVFRFAEEGGELGRFLERLNRMVFRVLHRKKMMTFFACLLDPAEGVLTYSTAGHPYPIVVRANGTLERLRLIHSPLGFRDPCEPFVVQTDRLLPGDLLFLYTDGILEARNADGEYFGKQRLEEILRRTSSVNPAAVRESVVQSVQAFQQMADDDLTLLAVKRSSE
ncbi:MAG TPA: PP2C family protein-serine/threonine phosphatase, partial [Candidatus Ozemobacteraceae bacterium]|nr:PP2C family protein-serine/threonine phosphatase [Candidatus Ozemobacteraceae bacterium]